MDVENLQTSQSLHPVDSNETLTNRDLSAQSTPQPSRNSSRERLRKDPMKLVSKGAKTTHRYLSHELDPSWMGVVVVVCFFTSGLIDSVAFNTWNCFVGMQTGNTVFAALGLGGQPEATHAQQYYKSLVSIAAFCFGSLCFNALHRHPTGLSKPPTSRKRWIFVVSYFMQTLLIIIAAVLVSLDLVSDLPFRPGTFSSGSDTTEDISRTRTNFVDLAPIAFLAFQAAGQCCLSRVLGVIELPTIVLSTLFHDFTADLYSLKNTWRNSRSVADFILVHHRRQQKRLFSILALFVGAVVGSEMYKSRVGMAGALWFAAALKLGMSMTFMAWKKDDSEEQGLPL